jgi:hypothetical protein
MRLRRRAPGQVESIPEIARPVEGPGQHFAADAGLDIGYAAEHQVVALQPHGKTVRRPRARKIAPVLGGQHAELNRIAAVQGKKVMLPVIGALAEKQA